MTVGELKRALDGVPDSADVTVNVKTKQVEFRGIPWKVEFGKDGVELFAAEEE